MTRKELIEELLRFGNDDTQVLTACEMHCDDHPVFSVWGTDERIIITQDSDVDVPWPKDDDEDDEEE